MPILKPKSGETMSDFIARFMGDDKMISEFPENDQRLAVAQDQYKEYVKNYGMARLEGVEIFRAGLANDGRSIAEKEISEIVNNTMMIIIDGLKPKVKIGDHHDKAKTAGIIERVYQKGRYIFGDMSVPASVYEKMSKGMISTHRSIETLSSAILTNGKKIGKFISAIVFGMDVSALHDLASVFGSLETSGEGDVAYYEYTPETNKKELKMGEITIKSEDYQSTISRNTELEKENQSLKSEIEKFEKNSIKREDFEKFESENKKLKDENEKLKKSVDEFESKMRESFVDKMIEDQIIIPAQKPSVLSFYEHNLDKFSDDPKQIEKAQKAVSEMFQSRVDIHTEPGLNNDGKKESVNTDDAFDPTA